DLLLGELDLVEHRSVIREVVAQYPFRRGLELLTQCRVGEWRVQMRLNQARHFARVGHVTAEGPGMHLRKGVVKRLTVPQRLVDRGVEAVQDAQLELVRAFKEVLQVGEGEDDVCDSGPWLRREALSGGVIRGTPLHVLRGQNVVPELGGGYVSVVLSWDR